MAYLSVPSPGKWILDIFGKNMFRPFLDHFSKPRSRGSKPRSFHDRASVPSTRSEHLMSHTNFSTRIHLSTSKKINFLVDVEKGTSFWALFLLCCRWFCFSEKRRFLEKQDPWKGSCLDHFWSFLSKCPKVIFLGGGLGEPLGGSRGNPAGPQIVAAL